MIGFLGVGCWVLGYKLIYNTYKMTLEYWNELAKQTLLISSLLSGFSIAVVANLLVSDKNDRLTNSILKVATLAAGCFLISVFAMVNIVMTTTPGGYITNVTVKDFQVSRTIGLFAFMIGLFALAAMIALSGWTKSKKVGRFTTIIGILTLVLIFITMTRFSV
jgi:cytochrome bd-type quinol oxidase subunit 2